MKLEEKEKYQREVQNIRKQVCVKGITYTMVSKFSVIFASLIIIRSISPSVIMNNHFLGLTMSCTIIKNVISKP